jgi:hypothetical protein
MKASGKVIMNPRVDRMPISASHVPIEVTSFLALVRIGTLNAGRPYVVPSFMLSDRF